MRAPQPVARLGGLDGLRGLAALAVFAVHYNQVVGLEARAGPFDLYTLLANGEHGVSLFFILSGFLLSLPFWRSLEPGAPRPSLPRYALRRMARVLPAYYLLLTVLAVAWGLWRIPAGRVDLALHYALVFNYADFAFMSINPPFWTLAVEMQFYVFLPLLFLLLRPLRPVPACVAVAAAGAVAYGAHLALVSNWTLTVAWSMQPWLNWVSPRGPVVHQSLLAHLPHFLLGVIAARAHLGAAPASRAARIGADAGAVFCVTVVVVLLATDWGDAVRAPAGRYGLPLLPILLALVVWLTPRSLAVRGMLERAPLRALGAVSYGVYVYHLPLLRLLDDAMRVRGVDVAAHPAAFAAAGLAATLVAAALSYRLLERPLLGLAHRAPR